MSDDESNQSQGGSDNFVLPASLRRLRACIRCKLVKTEKQWKEDGCENCNNFEGGWRKMTTPNFEGTIFVTKPKESWVGRWNRLGDVIPGCYCVRASGEKNESDREDDDY